MYLKKNKKCFLAGLSMGGEMRGSWISFLEVLIANFKRVSENVNLVGIRTFEKIDFREILTKKLKKFFQRREKRVLSLIL